MKFWRVVGVVVMSLFLGCAVTPYREAESYISKKEYKQALQIYLKALNPHVRNGKRYIGYEPEAMTGVGVVLWYMKRYSTAAKVLGQVAKKTPQYGKALYYLGGCYESLKKLDKASDVYRRYALLDEFDPYREFMRWRSEWISRQNVAQDVKSAMAQESTLTISDIPKETVAVLYFQNLSKNSWSPLQKGVAQTIIDDLSNLDQIKVIDREKVQKLMDAMGWTPQTMAQDSRAAQVGKLLGARTLVKGTYKILPDQKIELTVGTVYVPESKTPEYTKFNGTLANLLSLEKKMVLRIISDLGLTLTPEQERQIAGPATRDFKAFAYFCYGLNDMDAGRFDSAQKFFKQAVGLDPDFFMAQDWIVDPDIFRITHVQQFALMNERVQGLVGKTGGYAGALKETAGVFAVSPTGRLQELGAFMDAGFIPSNDSRNLRDTYVSQMSYQPPETGSKKLPVAPPPPPGVVSRWVLPGPPNPPSRH
jgi:tetratricopeptide (TPR) repeat protein